MATIGDLVKNFWANYVAPTKEEVSKGRKEEKLIEGDPNYPTPKDNPFSRKLTVEKCIEVAEQCPLFMKGARKKARDSVRAWHRIEHIDKTKTPTKIDLVYLRNFMRRNNLRKLWETLRVAAFTTGDGYLLITFDGDDETEVDDEPAEGSCPYKARILNSKFIVDIGYHPTKKHFQEKFTKHFHYVDTENNKDDWIHPDRIVHMTNDELFGEFGNSKTNLLRNIIKSSVNIDIATGDILAWFAHGLLDIKLLDTNENEIKKWKRIVRLHPGAYIHDDEVEIKAIAPQAIDPKPFYDYLILSIAASFFMPTHILTGIQVGKVTGAEVGTGDYVKDLKDDQDLDFSPLLNRLYEMILKGKGRATWDNYEIIWNPIYIDELSEAIILEKKVLAAETAFNGSRGAGGFIDQEEARRIFNIGQITLDASKKIKVKAPVVAPSPEKPDDKKAATAKDIVKPTKKVKEAAEKYGIDLQPNLYDSQLDAATKIMIEKRKEQVKKERKLGDDILEEQDDDANKS